MALGLGSGELAEGPRCESQHVPRRGLQSVIPRRCHPDAIGGSGQCPLTSSRHPTAYVEYSLGPSAALAGGEGRQPQRRSVPSWWNVLRVHSTAEALAQARPLPSAGSVAKTLHMLRALPRTQQAPELRPMAGTRSLRGRPSAGHDGCACATPSRRARPARHLRVRELRGGPQGAAPG